MSKYFDMHQITKFQTDFISKLYAKFQCFGAKNEGVITHYLISVISKQKQKIRKQYNSWNNRSLCDKSLKFGIFVHFYVLMRYWSRTQLPGCPEGLICINPRWLTEHIEWNTNYTFFNIPPRTKNVDHYILRLHPTFHMNPLKNNRVMGLPKFPRLFPFVISLKDKYDNSFINRSLSTENT